MRYHHFGDGRYVLRLDAGEDVDLLARRRSRTGRRDRRGPRHGPRLRRADHARLPGPRGPGVRAASLRGAHGGRPADRDHLRRGGPALRPPARRRGAPGAARLRRSRPRGDASVSSWSSSSRASRARSPASPSPGQPFPGLFLPGESRRPETTSPTRHEDARRRGRRRRGPPARGPRRPHPARGRRHAGARPHRVRGAPRAPRARARRACAPRRAPSRSRCSGSIPSPTRRSAPSSTPPPSTRPWDRSTRRSASRWSPPTGRRSSIRPPATCPATRRCSCSPPSRRPFADPDLAFVPGRRLAEPAALARRARRPRARRCRPSRWSASRSAPPCRRAPGSAGSSPRSSAAPRSCGTHEVNELRRDLGENPATLVWPWGPGVTVPLPDFQARIGVDAAVVGVHPTVRGAALLQRIECIARPRAPPGGADSNLRAKARAALDGARDEGPRLPPRRRAGGLLPRARLRRQGRDARALRRIRPRPRPRGPRRAAATPASW